MLNLLLNNNDKEKLILIAVGIEGYQSARHNFIFHFSSIMYRSFVFNVCVGKGGGEAKWRTTHSNHRWTLWQYGNHCPGRFGLGLFFAGRLKKDPRSGPVT